MPCCAKQIQTLRDMILTKENKLATLEHFPGSFHSSPQKTPRIVVCPQETRPFSLKITSTSSTTFDPAGLRQGSPANQRPASIRIESEDQPKQCLAGEEEQKEKAKPTADEEEKTRKERLLNVSWGRGRKKGEVEDE